eukprot:s5354_g7.t1
MKLAISVEKIPSRNVPYATGDNAKRGQWEWRIDPNSGPEAPEGWTYNLPHKVTWGNKPNVHLTKGPIPMTRVSGSGRLQDLAFVLEACEMMKFQFFALFARVSEVRPPPGSKARYRKLGGRVETVRKIALIERYGFRGYTRIPVDEVALSDPLTKSPLLEAFPNTELPVYE